MRAVLWMLLQGRRSVKGVMLCSPARIACSAVEPEWHVHRSVDMSSAEVEASGVDCTFRKAMSADPAEVACSAVDGSIVGGALAFSAPASETEIFVGVPVACSGTCPGGSTVHGLYWDEYRLDAAAVVTVDGSSWTATLTAWGEDAGKDTLYLIATVGGVVTTVELAVTVTQRRAEIFANFTHSYFSDVGLTVSGSDVTNLADTPRGVITAEDLVDGGTGALHRFLGSETGDYNGEVSWGTDDNGHGLTLETVDGSSQSQPWWLVVIGGFRGDSVDPHWFITNEDDSNVNCNFRVGSGHMGLYANNGVGDEILDTEITNLPGVFIWECNGASSAQEARFADGNTFRETVAASPGSAAFTGLRLGTGYNGYGRPHRVVAVVKGSGAPVQAELEAFCAQVVSGKYRLLGYEHDPPIALPSETIQTICTSDVPQATIGIPRHKLTWHPDFPTTLRLVISSALGNTIWQSPNAGNSWRPLQRVTLDYHCAAEYCGDGTLIVTAPRTGGASVWRWPDPGVYWDDLAAEVVLNQHSGSEERAVACANGTDVYVATRPTGDVGATIRWSKSTDSGASFTSSGVLRVCTGMHRVGLCLVDGEVMAMVWEQTGEYEFSFQAYRWDPNTSALVLNGDALVCADGNNAETREFTWTAIGTTIHLVWWDTVGGHHVLRHAYRAHTAGAWSAPTTVETWDDHNHDPCVTHVGSTLYLAYCYNAGGGGAYRGVYTRSWTSGGGWTNRVERSTSTGGSCTYPQMPQHMPASAEALYLAYTQGDGSPYAVRFRGILL